MAVSRAQIIGSKRAGSPPRNRGGRYTAGITCQLRIAKRRACPGQQTSLDVVVQITRGSFLKRAATGRIDFVSPLACPVNYGSVPQPTGLERDSPDVVVLGPRLPPETNLLIRALELRLPGPIAA